MIIKYFLLLSLTTFWGCSNSTLRSVASLAEMTKDTSELGTLMVQNQESNFIITAPHGTNDYKTDEVAAGLCENLGWDCVIAKDYRRPGQRINVNRPTEGAGLAADNENHSEQARIVFETFIGKINEINPPEHRLLYVEIHGNSRPQSVRNIEIALVNFSAKQARKLKEVFNENLKSSEVLDLSAYDLLPLRVLVEGIDSITFRATGSKKFGSLGVIGKTKTKVIHIELPKVLRAEKLNATIRYLTQSLSDYHLLLL